MKTKKCIECNNLIQNVSTYCKSCANKGIRHHNFNKPRSIETREKISKFRKGKSRVELLGFEKAQIMTLKHSIKLKGLKKTDKFRKLASERMKINNPMQNPIYRQKANESNKLVIKLGLKKQKIITQADRDRMKNLNLGKKFSIEHINKLKKARRKQITPLIDTKPEIIVQNFLSELQIPFLKHEYMNQIEHSYQCDILIPALFMVIECDGNYWHNYPVGNDIDHIRTKELEEQTFRVIRLWESEIHKMNLQDFKQRIGVN